MNWFELMLMVRKPTVVITVMTALLWKPLSVGICYCHELHWQMYDYPSSKCHSCIPTNKPITVINVNAKRCQERHYHSFSRFPCFYAGQSWDRNLYSYSSVNFTMIVFTLDTCVVIKFAYRSISFLDCSCPEKLLRTVRALSKSRLYRIGILNQSLLLFS